MKTFEQFINESKNQQQIEDDVINNILKSNELKIYFDLILMRKYILLDTSYRSSESLILYDKSKNKLWLDSLRIYNYVKSYIENDIVYDTVDIIIKRIVQKAFYNSKLFGDINKIKIEIN